MPCEPSKGGLGGLRPLGSKVEKWRWATERWFRDIYVLSWQTFWFSRSVWRKQWLWKAFHFALSNSLIAKMTLELGGWQIEAWANQSSIFTPRMSYSGPLGCGWILQRVEEYIEDIGFRWWFWLTNTSRVEKVHLAFLTRQTTQFAPTQWNCFQFQRW